VIHFASFFPSNNIACKEKAMQLAMVYEESLCLHCQRPVQDDFGERIDVLTVFCDEDCQGAYWQGIVEAAGTVE
jgi:hypothetical protein